MVFDPGTPAILMFKILFISACLASIALASPVLSGTVVDVTKTPIDGARVTLWNLATRQQAETSSSGGSFSLNGLAGGNYMLKIESDNRLSVLAAFQLAGDQPHKINVIMLDAIPTRPGSAGAGSPLRDSVRPPRSSTTSPKVRPAQVRKKSDPIYPDADRKAHIKGDVRIAMIILSDGTLNDLVAMSAPSDSLAVAALVAVSRWQYSPTYLDDQPVEASLTVNVTFQ
jgi:TonB family protein